MRHFLYFCLCWLTAVTATAQKDSLVASNAPHNPNNETGHKTDVTTNSRERKMLTTLDIPVDKVIGVIAPLFTSKNKCNVSVCFQNNAATTIKVIVYTLKNVPLTELLIAPNAEGCSFEVKAKQIYKYIVFQVPEKGDAVKKTESQVKPICEAVKITIQ